MMKITPFAAAMLIMIAALLNPISAWAQSSSPTTAIQRSVPRDAETQVFWSGNWRTLPPAACAINFIPALTLVSPASHGTVRIGTAENTPRGSGCQNAITGAAIFYRPNPGFVGQDQFTFNLPGDPMARTWLGPPPGNRTVVITVH